VSQTDAKFRTILIAGYPNNSWNALIRNLALEGHLVLTARDGEEAIQIAKTHSRPIHLLIVGQTNPALFTELRPYQPGIRILVLASPETALARVRELLQPPQPSAACA